MRTEERDLDQPVVDLVAAEAAEARPSDEPEELGESDLAASGLAFEDIWRHRDELHDLCQRIVGDAAMADDLVQETYLQALKNLDKLERRDGLMPWLVTVAKRRSLNELRRRKYSTVVETMPERPTKPEHDPGESISLSDEVTRVQSLLEQLTDRERELLTRQVYDGLSLNDLAAMDGSSAASVRSVLSRARAKIKASVADAGSRALLPVAAFAEWSRRRIDSLALRVHRTDPALSPASPVSLRLGEAFTAGVLALTMGVPGGLATADPADRAPVTAEVAAPSVTAAPPPAPTTTAPATPQPEVAVAPPPQSVADEAPAPEPSPTDLVPIDPADPFPRADDPEEASDHQVYEPDGGSDELFSLARTMGKCRVGCSVLFRSVDGGVSWTQLRAAGLEATSLLFPPAWPDDARIFAMGSSGLQVSVDGGETFGPVLGATQAGPAAMSPGFSTGDARILVGSAPPWEYDDAGRTTRPIAGAPLSPHEIRFAFTPGYPDSGLLFASTFALEDEGPVAAVYTCETQLGGDVCARRAVLEGVDRVARVAVSSTFSDDGLIFAWSGEHFLRSADGGHGFEPVALPLDTVAAVTDDGEGTVYAAGDADDGPGGIARSTDGGATWTLLGSGTPLEEGVETVTVTAGGHLLAGRPAYAGGGIFCSTDGGASWAPRCGV